MSRARAVYQCAECGLSTPQWAGQCAGCGAWNTLSELRGPAGAPPGSRGVVPVAGLVQLAQAQAQVEARRSTGLAELDRVLGGGLVTGGVVLLGGDPGIGKSTLILQALAHLSTEVPVLYVSGEESAAQIAARAGRLGLGSANIPLLTESTLETILAASANGPRVVAVDSIQTVQTEALPAAAGSVSQVRECAAQLVRFAKQRGVSVLLVGHVTKEGALAGPRVLEHAVDTVLYFEGDADSQYRIVRAHKNRYGSVNELGVFAMSGGGLKEVGNPSAIFLTRHPRPVAGSVVLATLEGTRPLLIEVQALVERSPLGTPRRVCLGMDPSRLALLLAVLHRHAGVVLYDHDVYVNLVGGLKVTETATDLPLLLAAMSSLRDRPLPMDLVAFGEVGLAGELRPVRGGQERLREAEKLGFKRAVISRMNAPRRTASGMEIHGVEHVQELLGLFDALAGLPGAA